VGKDAQNKQTNKQTNKHNSMNLKRTFLRMYVSSKCINCTLPTPCYDFIFKKVNLNLQADKEAQIEQTNATFLPIPNLNEVENF